MRKKFMESFRKFTVMFVLIQMVMVLFPTPVVHASAEGYPNNDEMVTICHATGSVTNPYQKKVVSSSAIEADTGHNSDNHQDGRDIIPSGAWDSDGRNWDAEGIAIWSNNCTVPELDNTAPIFGLYTDITVPATSSLGAAVNYILPTAADDVDGSITPVCNPVSGSQFAIGVTKVTCTAVDSFENSATLSFNVTVVDEAPVIVLNGDNPMRVEKGTLFDDPGAIVIDAVDKDLLFTLSGSVDVNIPGDYIITYSAIDSAGNSATPVERTVTVVDTIKPEFDFVDPTPEKNKILNADNFEIRVKGDEDIDYCKVKIDGKIADMNNGDGYFNYSVEGLLDGVYKYKVSCWDEAENKSSKSRLIIIDTLPPDFDFVSPTPDDRAIINENILEIRVSGDEDIQVCQVWLNEEEFEMDQDMETGEWYTVFNGLQDGFYEYLVVCSDEAGNENSSEIRLLSVDTSIGNGDGDNNDGGDGRGQGAEPTVLTPVTLVAPVALAVAGDVAVAEEQAIISETTDKEKEEILGEEKKEEEEERCDWWWILAIILAAVLGGNYMLARKYHENEKLKKALMVTPIAFGLLALYAHQILGEGLRHLSWCYYLWLIVAALVGAYYLIKNYFDKKEAQK